MALETGLWVEDLQALVANPGGPTEAGIKIFEQHNMSHILYEACKQCLDAFPK